MIYIKDHVLSNEDIDQLRPFVEKQEWSSWDQSLTVSVPQTNDIVQKVKNAVNSNFDNSLPLFNEVDWSQIVVYDTGCSMNFHLDQASDKTTGTSVTFLNEDFAGGEAIVEGVQIAPIKGRTYYMDGKMYKHAVLNVIKGARYTLTCWYKKING